MWFLPPALGVAALATLHLTSLRQESDTPMVSHPYMMAGTLAVLTISAAFAPTSLRALYFGMVAVKLLSLLRKVFVDRRAPPTVSVPRILACLSPETLPPSVASTMACAMDGLLAMTLDFFEVDHKGQCPDDHFRRSSDNQNEVIHKHLPICPAAC